MAAELLPTERQLAALLRKVTLAAQQTGVEFLVFRPDPAKPQEHYTELPLQLSVYGSYHQVGSFLAELANMRRILTVSNLELKTNVAGKEDGSMTTAADFTASAFCLNTAASAPAATTTPATTPAAPDAAPKGGETHDKKS